MRLSWLVAGMVVAVAPLAPASIIINEFYKGSNFSPTGRAYIEFLIVQRLSIEELNTLFFGNASKPHGPSRFSAYRFDFSAEALGPELPAGTRIVVGGGAVIPEGPSSTYDPRPGADEASWTLLLRLPASPDFEVMFDNLRFASEDMIWLDDEWQPVYPTAPRQGISWFTSPEGAAAAAPVHLNLAGLGEGTVSFMGDPSNPGHVADPSHYATGPGTFGAPNSVDEERFLAAVRNLAPIPEPAPYAWLLGLPALAWASFRRRANPPSA